MGPRPGLERCEKSRPPPGFDPRTVQPVASRHIDHATQPTFDTLVTTYCNHCRAGKEVAHSKQAVFSLYIIHIRRNGMTDPQNNVIFRVNLKIISHDFQGRASTDTRHVF